MHAFSLSSVWSKLRSSAYVVVNIKDSYVCFRYNKCFDFKCTFGIPGRFPERQVDMTMTSVSGHLNEMDFDAQ